MWFRILQTGHCMLTHGAETTCAESIVEGLDHMSDDTITQLRSPSPHRPADNGALSGTCEACVCTDLSVVFLLVLHPHVLRKRVDLSLCVSIGHRVFAVFPWSSASERLRYIRPVQIRRLCEGETEKKNLHTVPVKTTHTYAC